jgi:glyoxylase-like metal-dependent hydrolase (beta-lactamase superfamily II)
MEGSAVTSTTYRFKLGQFECLMIKDGGGPRVAAEFLPDAPLDELESVIRSYDLDPAAVEFSINILLVNTGMHKVLIDTGLGINQPSLTEVLVSEGVDPNTVDLVVITHGHGDHVGGVIDAAGQLRYPNAHYAISRTEWDYWTASDRFAPSDQNPAKAGWEALGAHRERVRLLNVEAGETEIVPGVSMVSAPGHTPGHIAVLIESEGQKLLHIADAAHQYFQLAGTDWSPNFDFDKVQSAQTRRALFERAAREELLLCAYHFTFPGVGCVIQQSGRLQWEGYGTSSARL